VVTIEAVLRQLLGHIPGDSFEQYADVAAVAARHTKSKKPNAVTEKTDETTPEVVE
jgi:hypothetical protein